MLLFINNTIAFARVSLQTSNADADSQIVFGNY